ncbi:MAG: SBBP repeat-containing protein [Planctomycetota bacterium]|nr:SBBP repeat-containing protein [Planctomycetota bacterium]
MKPKAYSLAAVVETLEHRRMLASTIGYVVTFGQERQANTGLSVVVDSAGNSYVTGTFGAAINVNPLGKQFILTRGNGNGAFIAKYSPKGMMIWAKRLVGRGDTSGLQIKLGPTGDVYVAGMYSKSISFDGPTKAFLTSVGGQDVFVMRLSNRGALKWFGNLGGKKDDGVDAMAIGPDGDVYLAGYVRLEGDIDPTANGVLNVTTRGVDDTFIERLGGKDGHLIWSRVFGERDTSEAISGMVVDPKRGLIVAGSFQREVEFDRQNPAFNRESDGKRTDIYYGRLNLKTGGWSLLNVFGSSDTDYSSDIALAPSGGAFYITGQFQSTMQVTPGNPDSVLSPIGEQDVFIAKFTAAGEVIWARQIGGNDSMTFASGVAVDPAGNAYATGWFNDSVIVDPGSSQVQLTIDKSGDGNSPFGKIGSSEVYITQFAPNGDLRYAKQIGGDDAGIVSAAIAVNSAGNALVTGNFNGTANFAPAPGKPVIRKTDDNRKEAAAFLVKILG